MSDDILGPSKEPTRGELKAALDALTETAKARISELESRFPGCVAESDPLYVCSACNRRFDRETPEVTMTVVRHRGGVGSLLRLCAECETRMRIALFTPRLDELNCHVPEKKHE